MFSLISTTVVLIWLGAPSPDVGAETIVRAAIFGSFNYGRHAIQRASHSGNLILLRVTK
jgi:hypothetical protein